MGRVSSSSSSCLASIIAILKSLASRSMRSCSIPLSDAVRTSRLPKPNMRPKTDSTRMASLIFSSDESDAFLLMTPSAWMSRREVMTYSWLRKLSAPQAKLATPITTRITAAQPRRSHSRPLASGLTSRRIVSSTAISSPRTAQRARQIRMNQCWCAILMMRSPDASSVSA